MPPARAARRAITDENADHATTRLTRAKAASLTTDTDVADPPKKTVLGTKHARTTSTANGAALGARKRTALGDVSNVGKKEIDDTTGKKNTILSKTTKPAGIQKPPTRTNSTRTVLGQKVTTSTTSDLKRPASGAGGAGHLTKKRVTSTIKVEDEENDASTENVDPSRNGSGVSIKAEKNLKPKQELVLDDEDQDIAALDFEQMVRDAKDLDAEDMEDPLMVAEYVHEIFDYMKELELSTQPNPDYMDSQGDLQWNMRGILVDWLLEVHTRFRLLPETLFLAINIIDRFLSTKVVQLDRLQLVGVTAMFIAAKYEEILSPHVQNFVHVADDGFTEAEILSAERFILSALDYDLSYPNPMNFLRRISKADSYDIQTRTLGKYLLEIGCLDHRFLKYPPSHVAAAAMFLSRLVLDRGEWDATLVKYSGYTQSQIKPVFELMVDYLYGPVAHDAFFRKYASKKFLKASIVLRQWAKKYGSKYLANAVEQPSSGKTPRS